MDCALDQIVALYRALADDIEFLAVVSGNTHAIVGTPSYAACDLTEICSITFFIYQVQAFIMGLSWSSRVSHLVYLSWNMPVTRSMTRSMLRTSEGTIGCAAKAEKGDRIFESRRQAL